MPHTAYDDTQVVVAGRSNLDLDPWAMVGTCEHVRWDEAANGDGAAQPRRLERRRRLQRRRRGWLRRRRRRLRLRDRCVRQADLQEQQ